MGEEIYVRDEELDVPGFVERHKLNNPEFEKAERVHDWRNYVIDDVQAIWSTFTDAQKIALYENFDEMASREEWE